MFGVGDCNDGDDNMGDNEGFDLVTGDTADGAISQVGTVSATYSFDPKTAADSPRGILTNSDLIKISIQDTGRDKRTPVYCRSATLMMAIPPMVSRSVPMALKPYWTTSKI